jgi:hypothetical protein
MTERSEPEEVDIIALDEEGAEEALEGYEGDPNAPMITDEIGAILDRLASENEEHFRRSEHSGAMNDMIRKAFGRGG